MKKPDAQTNKVVKRRDKELGELKDKKQERENEIEHVNQERVKFKISFAVK